jgi:hypothetical protein
MLFNILFVVDWHKIGEHRQSLTDCGNQSKNVKCIDYDYKVRAKILVINEGILRKAESSYSKEHFFFNVDSGMVEFVTCDLLSANI